MRGALVLALAAVLAPRPAHAWGRQGHRLVASLAVERLPPALRAGYSPRLAELGEACLAADERKATDPAERPRHYLDLEPFAGAEGLLGPDELERALRAVPRTRADLDALRGPRLGAELGTLPWALEQSYRDLVRALRREDHEAALRHVGDLCHYLGDLHVPLHVTADFQGQRAGNCMRPDGPGRTVHERFEVLLVEHHLDRLRARARALARAAPATADDLVTMALTRSRDAYLGLEPLLAADRELLDPEACTAAAPSWKRYADGLRKRVGEQAALALSRGADDLAGLLVRAHAEAGRLPPAGAPRALAGPVVLGVSRTAATVLVQLDRPATRARAVARAGKLRVESAAASGPVLRLALGGLRPDTRYTFAVEADGATVGSGAFGTAPEREGSFTFLVYGDNRSDDGAHAAVVAAMRREHADFALHTGDVTEDGDDLRGWERFFGISRELLRTLPLYPAYGNHDGAGFERFYGLPRRYAFAYGAARFVVLDGGDGGAGQAAWLRAELGRARDDRARHVFVLMHQPLYSPGPHGDGPALIARLGPELARRDVPLRAVFAGHDHLYARLVQDQVTHFVTGGGGAPVYPWRHGRSRARLELAESVHHYLRVRVRGDHVTVTAIRVDGTLIEELAL